MQPNSAVYLTLGLTASQEIWAGNACFSHAYLLLEHTEQSQGLIKVGIPGAQMSKLVNTRPLSCQIILRLWL